MERLHKDLTPNVYMPAGVSPVARYLPKPLVENVMRVVEYCAGVLTALEDRKGLIRGFEANYKPRSLVCGWQDLFDPHLLDVVVDGRRIATIETHHDGEIIFVYTEHPDANSFARAAEEYGFRPVDSTIMQ